MGTRMFGLSYDSKYILNAISKSQAIIEFDLKGNILKANENFCNALGYRLDEIVGKHHSMFCEPAYTATPEYRAFWARLGRGEYDAGAYKRLAKGNSEIWIQASYNPVFKGGKPFRVVKFAADITAAKKQAVEDSGKLQAISRSQAVIEFTPKGEILTANENFCKAMGYSWPRSPASITASSASRPMSAPRITAISGGVSPMANSLPTNSSASARTAAKSGSRRLITRSSMPTARSTRS